MWELTILKGLLDLLNGSMTTGKKLRFKLNEVNVMIDPDYDPKEGQNIGAGVFFLIVIMCFGALYLIVDNADYIDGTARHQGQRK